MSVSVDKQTVRDYCQHHPLSRPKVNLYKVMEKVAIIECLILAISLFAYRLGIVSIWGCEDVMHLLVVLILGKSICKTAVRLYQQYASEKTRRKCRCMPSCSEYALLALDKYWWPKALWLIYRRLTHTCMQPGYKVDYP